MCRRKLIAFMSDSLFLKKSIFFLKEVIIIIMKKVRINALAYNIRT